MSTLAWRLASIGASVFINFYIALLLPPEELGIFFVLITVSYFGNALFFNGADIAFQRKIKEISIDRTLNFAAFQRYFLKALPIGAASVVVLVALIWSTSSSAYWSFYTLAICTLLSCINFFISGLRNILLLAGEKVAISRSMFFEQFLRLSLIFLVGRFQVVQFTTILLVYIFSTSAAVVLAYIAINKRIEGKFGGIELNMSREDFKRTILPSSLGYVLAWAQTQGYRIFVGATLGLTAVVGPTSFLLNLGTTGANAILGVLAQWWVPKQFSSSGASTTAYLKVVAIAALILVPCAWLAAYVTIGILNKPQFRGLELVVVVGVLIETGSAFITIIANHYSLTRGGYLPAVVSPAVGLPITAFSIFFVQIFGRLDALSISYCLLFGQGVGTVFVVYCFIFRRRFDK